ncbi:MULTISPECIES: pilus assembly FimT family protein [Campylobacter]|uniref:pilus assembly FimT family protein n=2 Tax=Campylobacteraceae TaxID=72294 RepID=UPI000A358574|nr:MULTISPECIES: type II secretion system protein [unclassified Campylobacter]MEE3711460.1 type II secretion system protein [Campylobacter sp. CLAX-7218-21]
MQKIKAFSLFELVIVMVVIGVLLSITTINFKNDDLARAANQVASHIRYTQFLALTDDKFNPEDKNWTKSRWQIYFTKTVAGKKVLYYSIFSDSGGYSGSPDGKEIAKNPLNPAKVLSVSHAGISTINPTDELDLMEKFNLNDVELLGGCSQSGSTRISFDNLGRPFKGNPKSANNSTHNLITSTCQIRLTHQNGNCIYINLEPITGLISIDKPQIQCKSN